MRREEEKRNRTPVQPLMRPDFYHEPPQVMGIPPGGPVVPGMIGTFLFIYYSSISLMAGHYRCKNYYSLYRNEWSII